MQNALYYRHKGLTLLVHYDPPPIPGRAMDWCAYVDTWGADASPYGYGATREEALEDLKDQLDDMEAEGAL